MGELTIEQIENIVIEMGVVYVNYGESDERLLAPCKGSNVFNVEAEIREVEVGGLRGKTKGLRRKIREDASLELNLMDLSLENLKMALPGSVLVENKLTNGWVIKNEDYLKNVTLIGEDMGGNYKKITIYNALMDEALSIEMSDKEESSIQLKLSGHYDPEDKSHKLYNIEDLTDLIEG